MYCTKCGFEISDDARYCSRCGTQISVGPARTAYSPLMLDKRSKKIAGVCAGFARHLGVDVVLVRVIWLGIALCTGVGFIAYLAAWIVIPSDYGFAATQGIVRAPQTAG